ncbi:MAG TPA: RNase adapter RapZ [Polyangiaceae bacterium]|nr:RNase adapter RapZ [Polyangiaceae bacterium]
MTAQESRVAAVTSVVVVTGLSGAGKSTAVNALEDLGYFCVDSLPTPVLPATLAAFAAAGVRRVAFGIDVRVRRFLDDAAAVLAQLEEPGERELTVLFLDAADEALLRRFSSTRRPHPLTTTAEAGSEQGALAVLDGIRIERTLLTALRARASIVFDTTRMSVHDLRREVLTHFGQGAGGAPRLKVRLLSFGFKFGPPVDADMVFDVRFLDNPYFVPQLSKLSGLSPAVRDFVQASEGAAEFVDRSSSLLEFCLPRFAREGKSYLTLGVGCTGGRHRSVVIAEQLAERLRKQTALPIDVVHRDVERVNISGGDPDGGHST